MQVNNGPAPIFLPPSNGSNHRPPGYVPGRIAPVRSPPPPKMAAPPKPSGGSQHQATFVVSDQQRREHVHGLVQRKNAFICCATSLAAFFLVLILVLSLTSADILDENCPHHNPSLSSWNPGHNPQKRVVIRKGNLYRLESSATLQSIIIQSGGLLVFADDVNGSRNITLRTRHIAIEDGGALYIGAAKCRYRSHATIALVGRSDEAGMDDVPGFGRKFIGVRAGGTLELHGVEKLSWTLLAKTLPSAGLPAGGYAFQKNFSRGINLRVVDPDTGAVIYTNRFDTHDSQDDSRKLHELLKALPRGRIVAMAVGDSAAKSLLDETKKTIQDLLGSTFVNDLQYRQAWALVSVIGGGNDSCSEAVREHENHDTGGQALAQKRFVTVDGEGFSVSAYSEWRNGKPQFTHVGEILDGIDMRAEVALLTRNILIQGEMENYCYGSNWCHFFGYDSFGGQIKILANFTAVHLSHVELKHMGQQVGGGYPLHFSMCGDVDEQGGYSLPTYVEALSIHHCFSRCITVQATHGLLIKDVIGYDTLGHCFFLEDGIEQRNTFFHNLGLVTKPGTILPTDRNETMCTSIRNKVYGNYVPVPGTECKAVSTFWIANPNNNLISNAAAGSQDAGIWYIFHSASTGKSHGLIPETKAELTPLGIFFNNRVHSNFKAGLFIDKGVKTTNASATDPREYLCLDNSARFRPHENADPKRPRVAALIDTLISFKNNDLGAWIRGGDIVIQNSGFADNGVGLSFASDGSYPKDEGSSQEVSQSLFVGESKNRGFNGGQNKYWGVGGVDGKPRTLPRNKTFPIRGFQIYDGPVHLTSSTFKNFVPTPDRFTSAVGFNLKNTWQLTPRNNVSSLLFLPSNSTLKAFFGKPGQWFEDNDLDGDKNSIFHDVDGSVTGFPDSYAGRLDNFLIRHPDCINITEWNGVVCSGRYSQVYIQTQGASNLTLSISRDEYPNKPMVLRGVNSQSATSQQYQPILMMAKSYTLHWNGRAPREVVMSLINFDKGDWVQVGLCYPSDTTFQVVSDIYDRQSNIFDNLEDYKSVGSLTDLEKSPLDRTYYFDSSTGLLWLSLRARHNRDGHSYCSRKGCERVKITATTTSKETSNCMLKAYPKYTKPPKATVPMPSLNTALCTECGASKVSSDITPVIKSLPVLWLSPPSYRFLKVNRERFSFTAPGFFLVTVDACTGRVIKKSLFPKMDAAMKQYLETVVSHILMHLPFLLLIFFFLTTESLAFFGFHGSSMLPPWVGLFTSQTGETLGLLEKYIPLGLLEYECAQPDQMKRKDLELLKKVLTKV
uniref:Cell migration inducing hyaluronidase 2 n=1 Tax=Scleropages formosus TaxID=113540 RepID=A0A8C9T704_SCLFO